MAEWSRHNIYSCRFLSQGYIRGRKVSRCVFFFYDADFFPRHLHGIFARYSRDAPAGVRIIKVYSCSRVIVLPFSLSTYTSRRFTLIDVVDNTLWQVLTEPPLCMCVHFHVSWHPDGPRSWNCSSVCWQAQSNCRRKHLYVCLASTSDRYFLPSDIGTVRARGDCSSWRDTSSAVSDC